MTSADTAAWLKAQVAEYRRLLPVYQRFAVLLEQSLHEAAHQLAPLALVQTRVKSVASFAEKALRKRDKYVMPAHQLTDLCGGRVIVRTLGELRALSETIEASFEVDWENSLDVARRLQPSQFGYRSVHYVVSVRPGPAAGAGPPIDLYGFDCLTCRASHRFKAEIQVRTTVQHAWADFAHDLAYKGAYPLPEHVQREVAVIAAELEEVDQSFGRIETELHSFAAGHGAYLTPSQLREEREIIDTVREHSPDDLQLAARSAQLSIRLGDWQRAADVLAPLVPPHPEPADAPHRRDLGIALCQLNRDDPAGEGYQRGQALLEQAATAAPGDGNALAALADTWRGIDDDRAAGGYLRALDLDPEDYYPLGGLLELQLGRPGPAGLVPVLKPLLSGTMKRCQAHARLRVNVPWALFALGRFSLLCGEPYEALHAYALGLRTASAPYMIDEAARSLSLVSPGAGHLEGFEWARRLVAAGRAARFPGDASRAAAAVLATPGARPLPGPLVVLAGATSPDAEPLIQGYRELVAAALSGFSGSIISGGTCQGISGLAAEAKQQAGRSIRLVGYLPGQFPPDATPDPRYDEIRSTTGAGFSPLEPLQYWIDLIAAGADPASVRILGINGGRIAAAEYRIAAALGATVGLIEDSGREAARLLADAPWTTSAAIIALPPDADAVRAFVSGGSALDPELTEILARAAHQVYLREAAKTTASDPALRAWDDLPGELRESNRDQAQHYAYLLKPIGCAIERVQGRPAAPMTFTSTEIDAMAAAEHGRWVCERLLSGWRWAAVRSAEGKKSPYLVPWDRLPEKVKELDRAFARNLPEILAAGQLKVRRAGPPG